MARRTHPSVKWMVLVLFEQLNVLLETQDVDFLLTTGANKEKLIEASEGGDEKLHACLVEMLKRQGIPTREEGGCYLVVTLQETQAGEHAADIAEEVGINAETYVSSPD